jgi:nucleotide-binding universal stress UspA family protein
MLAIRNILVPLDGSPFGEAAMDWAAMIASRLSATLHLVHVRTPLIVADPMLQYTVVDIETPDEAREYLVQLIQRLDWTGQKISTALAILEGSVAEALCRYAVEHGIDLVVMTTHGRGPWAKFWEGSVAETLVRTLPVAILLLRATEDDPQPPVPSTGFRHILMPIDQKTHPSGVGGMVLTLARHFGARVTLLHVRISAAPSPPSESERGVRQYESVPTEVVAAIEASQQRAAELGISMGVHVVSHDHPATAILEQAAHLQCDLIAMETRCRTGFARWVSGSTADRILRNATIPVLLHCSRHLETKSSADSPG